MQAVEIVLPDEVGVIFGSNMDLLTLAPIV
jgi:hypothetical protein